MFQKNSRQVKRFSRLMKVVAWLQALPNKITPAPFRLLQINTAFWQSRILYLAAKFDIATLIGDEQLSADSVAAKLNLSPEATFRMLRFLAAMGIFEQTQPGVFKNNKLSNCMRGGSAQNIRPMILMQNSPEMSMPWYQKLEEGVRSGNVPFELQYDDSLFSYLDTHSEFSKLFANAMDSVEVLSGTGFATDFDWGQFNRLIDIGGSKGAKAITILKQYPQLLALVVDQAFVVTDAKDYWNGIVAEEILSRMEFQAADILSDVPVAMNSKDIYFLCGVLHGYDDTTCIQILNSIFSSISDTGARVAIMEMIFDEESPDFAVASFDMQMFTSTSGKERTLKQWNDLIASSGFVLEEVVGLRGMGAILVLKIVENQ